jgi:hypothetical protein
MDPVSGPDGVVSAAGGAERGGKRGGGTVDLDGCGWISTEAAATLRTNTCGGRISTAASNLPPARLPQRI